MQMLIRRAGIFLLVFILTRTADKREVCERHILILAKHLIFFP